MPKPANPIPPGFHSVTVHLVPSNAAAYAEFLKSAFSAVEIMLSPGPGGTIMHGEMRIGDTIVMFADDFGAQCGMGPTAQGRHPFHLQLYVPDADATWAQALEAGCEVTMPISDAFWGDRYGHVRDPFGFSWAIATRKEELTPEEIQERAANAFAGVQK